MKPAPFDVWLDYGVILVRHAEKIADSVDMEDWQRCLSEPDFDTLLLYCFDAGSRQNCGSFCDAVVSWQDYRVQLKRAFLRFGFDVAARLVDEAISLDCRRNSE